MSWFKLRHALVCSINCILLAITHAYKYSWLLNLILLLLCRGLRGAQLFEDKYRGAEDRAELQGYIGEPFVRSTVDTLNDGRKYCLLIYNSY